MPGSDVLLQPEGMCVFQQESPAVIGGFGRDNLFSNKSPVLIIDQVEVIPLSRIVTDPEIPQECVPRIVVLHKCTD